MAFFTYVLGPIDFNWGQLKTVEETAIQLAKEDTLDALHPEIPSVGEEPTCRHFLARWREAQDEARNHHWEGDFRQDPVVFWLPGETGFEYGFAFKQDNNGTTFVMSPVPLPHLLDV